VHFGTVLLFHLSLFLASIGSTDAPTLNEGNKSIQQRTHKNRLGDQALALGRLGKLRETFHRQHVGVDSVLLKQTRSKFEASLQTILLFQVIAFGDIWRDGKSAFLHGRHSLGSPENSLGCLVEKIAASCLTLQLHNHYALPSKETSSKGDAIVSLCFNHSLIFVECCVDRFLAKALSDSHGNIPCRSIVNLQMSAL
jgi:hypothetical protein